MYVIAPGFEGLAPVDGDAILPGPAILTPLPLKETSEPTLNVRTSCSVALAIIFTPFPAASDKKPLPPCLYYKRMSNGLFDY